MPLKFLAVTFKHEPRFSAVHALRWSCPCQAFWPSSARHPLSLCPNGPDSSLTSAGVPNVHEIEMAAAATAAQLGLQLPPLNVPAHLQRAALALAMPDVSHAWPVC